MRTKDKEKKDAIEIYSVNSGELNTNNQTKHTEIKSQITNKSSSVSQISPRLNPQYVNQHASANIMEPDHNINIINDQIIVTPSLLNKSKNEMEGDVFEEIKCEGGINKTEKPWSQHRLGKVPPPNFMWRTRARVHSIADLKPTHHQYINRGLAALQNPSMPDIMQRKGGSRANIHHHIKPQKNISPMKKVKRKS